MATPYWVSGCGRIETHTYKSNLDSAPFVRLLKMSPLIRFRKSAPTTLKKFGRVDIATFSIPRNRTSIRLALCEFSAFQPLIILWFAKI
jgi:hypothetical protein